MQAIEQEQEPVEKTLIALLADRSLFLSLLVLRMRPDYLNSQLTLDI